MKTKSIDLNCDMGEGFGVWKMGRDAEIMKFVSSVNIACGFHAGDSTTIRHTVELSIENGVAIGAHPSFPDLQGFGRRKMLLTQEEIFDTVVYQVSAVKGICEASGARLHHVKPHGALYNMASTDESMASAIANAIATIGNELLLYGLSGSKLLSAGKIAGLETVSEVFADRTYQNDGGLTPRGDPKAEITETQFAVDQALEMAINNRVVSTDGKTIALDAETICIHGDAPNAVEFAQNIYSGLINTGVEIKAA